MIFLGTPLLLSTLTAQASPIIFTPNGDSNAGSLKCEVPLSSLGNLSLKNGSASISGKVITIKATSAYIDAPRTVLAGSVLRTEANLTSDPPHIAGLALFLLGDWQNQIDDGSNKDMIFCKDSHLEGRILGIENDMLSVNVNGIPQRIPLESVLFIRSPRVYVFKIALKSRQPLQKDAVIQAESQTSLFRPTVTARTLSGSVIPAGDRKDDLEPMSLRSSSRNLPPGMPGLGAENVMGGAGNLSPMNTLKNPDAAVPNQWDNSFDDGEDSRRFSTIHTRFGDQKMTLPPGLLD